MKLAIPKRLTDEENAAILRALMSLSDIDDLATFASNYREFYDLLKADIRPILRPDDYASVYMRRIDVTNPYCEYDCNICRWSTACQLALPKDRAYDLRIRSLIPICHVVMFDKIALIDLHTGSYQSCNVPGHLHMCQTRSTLQLTANQPTVEQVNNVFQWLQSAEEWATHAIMNLLQRSCGNSPATRVPQDECTASECVGEDYTILGVAPDNSSRDEAVTAELSSVNAATANIPA